MANGRKRLVLMSANMPQDVYDILSEKSKTRSLTDYVISLVEKEKKEDFLRKELASINAKLDGLDIKKKPLKEEKKELIINSAMPNDQPVNKGLIIDSSYDY